MLAILVFHNKTRHRYMNLFTFSKYFKHVDIYIYDTNVDSWIGFRTGSNGVEFTCSNVSKFNQIIDALVVQDNIEAVLTLNIEKRTTFKWCPLIIPMCNEFARHLTGVAISHTWNPGDLFRKLIKYDKQRNFSIVHQWRR